MSFYPDLSTGGVPCTSIVHLKLQDCPHGLVLRSQPTRCTTTVQQHRLLSRLKIHVPAGVTGSIPADCPAPFTALIHLGVSNTSVGGTLPACIVNTVHQLEISNTKFEGVFPNIEASSNLRYLIAETDPESASKFSGPFPRIDNAEHLHYANLNNHQVCMTCYHHFATCLKGFKLLVYRVVQNSYTVQWQQLVCWNNHHDNVQFEGTLPLANNVEAILAEGNKLTEVRVLNANRLELLDVAGNQISVLPAELEQLPNLQALHVDGNQLTKLPQIWAVDNLRDFTAARNKIEVRCCTLLVPNRPLPNGSVHPTPTAVATTVLYCKVISNAER